MMKYVFMLFVAFAMALISSLLTAFGMADILVFPFRNFMSVLFATTAAMATAPNYKKIVGIIVASIISTVIVVLAVFIGMAVENLSGYRVMVMVCTCLAAVVGGVVGVTQYDKV